MRIHRADSRRRVLGIGRLTQLADHPTDQSTLLAGAAGGRVWESTDAVVHWEPLMETEPTLTIGGVAYPPRIPRCCTLRLAKTPGGTRGPMAA